MAQTIASLLNLKMHFIEERTTKRMKRAYLPYTVQLHRNKDMGDSDRKFYLVNAFRLFPPDESSRNLNSSQNGNAKRENLSALDQAHAAGDDSALRNGTGA